MRKLNVGNELSCDGLFHLLITVSLHSKGCMGRRAYDTRQQNLFHVPLIFTKPLSRVSGVTLYDHFSNVLCLRVSYVTYKGVLKRHIIDNNTVNLLWTLWVDMPWHWSHNYLCCIEEVSSYSYDQCKWFDVRLLHLQCINNGNECDALNRWTCSLGFGEDCWHPGTVQGYQYLSQDTGYGRIQWWVAGPGVGVTKAPFVNFSVSQILDLAKVPVRLFASHSYLTGVTAAELRRHLSNMNMIFNG